MQEREIHVFQEFMKPLDQCISSDLFKSLDLREKSWETRQISMRSIPIHRYLHTLRLGVYGHSAMRRISKDNSCKPSIIRIWLLDMV